MNENKINKTTGFAILIIAAGIVFLLDRQGILPDKVSNIVISWQMLLIVIGLYNIFSPASRVFGYIVMLVGVFFLIPDLTGIYHYELRKFWPVLLIIFGILILAKHWRGKSLSDQTGSSDFDADMIDEFNVFSGSETIVSSQNFRGGKISSVFGGSKIDFSQAKLSQGYNEIEVFYLFGGTELIVPSGWEIENRVTSIMGGFTHKRFSSVATKPDSQQKLVIKGLVIFGGGEIRSL